MHKGMILAALTTMVVAIGCSSDDRDNDYRDTSNRRTSEPVRARDNFRDRDGDGIRDGLEDRDRDGVRDGNENGGRNRRDPDMYR